MFVTARLPKSRGIFILIMIAILAVASASPALAKQPTPGTLTETGTPLTLSSRVSGIKDNSANAAARNLTAARVNVIVKLEDSSLASYEGTVPGLAATNPQTSGKEKLDPKSPDSMRYRGYLKGKQDDFAANAAKAIPGASITHRFDVILGGVAMSLPSDQ